MFDSMDENKERCVFYDSEGEVIDDVSHRPSLSMVHDISGYAAAQLEAVNMLSGYAYSAQVEPEMFLEGFQNMSSIKVLGFQFSLSEIDEFIDRNLHYVSRREEAALRDLYDQLGAAHGHKGTGLNALDGRDVTESFEV